MSKEQIIEWLRGLIQARENIGQLNTSQYLYGYIDSAKSIIETLKNQHD